MRDDGGGEYFIECTIGGRTRLPLTVEEFEKFKKEGVFSTSAPYSTKAP